MIDDRMIQEIQQNVEREYPEIVGIKPIIALENQEVDASVYTKLGLPPPQEPRAQLYTLVWRQNEKLLLRVTVTKKGNIVETTEPKSVVPR